MGEEAFNARRYTTPYDTSALKYYSDIEANDPSSSLYKDGYNKIANKYLALAERAHKKGKVPTAREYVKDGLAVVPNHSKLLELQKELDMPAAVSGTTGVVKGVVEGTTNVFKKIF